MFMLIVQTFLLMLFATALGIAFGRLIADAGPFDDAETGSRRPWLDDLAPHPAAPLLPPRPALLPEAERARLAAALAASAARPAAVAVTAPVAAEPAASEAAPAPVAVPAPAAIVAPPPVVAEPVPEPVAVAAVAADPVAAALAAADATAAPVIAEADAGRAAEADAVGARPLGLAGPIGGTADDLKRIKGIGRQNEARLNALGVWHFAQIAAWTPENARWAGSFLAFHGRIEREDWVGQAKLLAAGLATEFSKRVDAGEVPTSANG